MPNQPTNDDTRLRRALAAFAEAHAGAPGLVLQPEEGIATALASGFDVEFIVNVRSSEAEVAGAAVDLVSQDEIYGSEMRALLSGPIPERFAVIETAVIVTAALVVLQTYVRIERKTDGRWSILVVKKPTNIALLNKLVSKLLAFL